ncbi:MAG TPA: TonB-dependent receptor [Sphingomicrobium sp.]|nr:TonB-dependent receptor [Sphingomicrobium sp.]
MLAALKCGVSAVSICALLPVAPAFAQAQPTQPTEPDPTEDQEGVATSASSPKKESDGTIVVTGIRRSLKRSQDIKRESDVIVDSVTAEDIGALPDRSVTEALQRIPGVAVDRIAAAVDPDHFAAEGSNVIVRGLTYVRSELNGRDTFSANNGRGLSFSDVPSELLGGVDVFKSPSADMIEGGISGIVNLRTRVPFDQSRRGLTLGGSIEGSWGDFRKEFAPTVSLMASSRWDTPIGDIGLLGSIAVSKLKWRSDGLQISNYGTRTLYTSGDVIPSAAATPVGGTACSPANPVQASCVYLPRGVAMRTTDTDRERRGYSAAAQWRSTDDSLLATLQFLRSDSRESWTEHALEIATDNVTSNGDSRAVPGTTLEFGDDGLFDNGVITGPTGWRQDIASSPSWSCNPPTNAGCDPANVRTPRFGLQSNNITRGQDNRFVTTDIGLNLKWTATDRLGLNLDLQRVKSKVNFLDVGVWASTFQNASIDMNGDDIPTVQLLPPEVCVGPAANSTCAGVESTVPPLYFGPGHTSFSDPYNSFWRSAMDHIEDSDGKEHAARFDVDYAFPESNWLDSIRAGARVAKRENVARFSTYNWGVLSEIWGGTGNGPVWLDENVDGIAGGTGGTPTAGSAAPFTFPDFMRGEAGDPQVGDPRLFYAGDPVGNYEQMINFARQVNAEWRGFTGPCFVTGGDWGPLAQRCGVVEGTPFLPGEINPIDETNKAGYMMARFKHEFAGGQRLSGNVGVRYSHTNRVSSGYQVFNQAAFPTETQCAAVPQPGQTPQPFCTLSLDMRNAARAWANGAQIANEAELTYDYWLPSFNAKLEIGNGIQFRAGFSKSITPPDFGLTRNYYNLSLSASQQDLNANNGIPLARATVGNPYLEPIRGTNMDLSAEWYFNSGGVGQLTLALFRKRLHGVLTNTTERIPFTNNGATFDAIITTPGNSKDTGKVRGLEIGYQQVYDFLPGFLSGLGLAATYTYVDSKGVPQSTLSVTDPDVGAGRTSNVDTSQLPLQGLSKHTINFAPFYEKGPLSVRLAYNWRSRFLVTVRDVIVPFAPIYQEDTGLLDGSIFYEIQKGVKIGVQAVNLTNEVTRTSQVINNELLTAPRSWFMNDRRFTGVIRFTY